MCSNVEQHYDAPIHIERGNNHHAQSMSIRFKKIMNLKKCISNTQDHARNNKIFLSPKFHF